jgi:hypothetical protein
LESIHLNAEPIGAPELPKQKNAEVLMV